MVFITEELVRKKAEHNESEICTLEELSLHQEDIEKIEHLQNWCKDLQILLLQNNLIAKIENLHKLKKLKYLNLAINNIEKIENLDRLESLEKLDLTLNFIGDLESVTNLEKNYNLKDLYLTGNPCTDYKGYRTYVIAKLPQLKNLDNQDLTKTERLKALTEVKTYENSIKKSQNIYFQKREAQRLRLLSKSQENIPDEIFWKQTSENAPETRIEISKRSRRGRGLDKDEEQDKNIEKPTLKFFTESGRPLNINQPKLNFKLDFEGPKEIILDLEIYKFLDSNLLNVELEPNFVRVEIKGKYFQLALNDEILVDKSTVRRSQTTGHLVITMPKMSYDPEKFENKIEKIRIEDISKAEKLQRREYLEIGGNKDRLTEICNLSLADKNNIEKQFIDDPEVPPLE